MLKSYADLHPHRIDRKTEIMMEHFHDEVRHRIGGLAKAMVVTRSRLHAVRFRIAFDKYLRENGYPYKALVAFSGQVRDPGSGETFTESGMNGFPENQTADAFKKAEFRFLIAANKFQTGFDQPLLHTMYVDKRLSGVNAVQTLSRLNRIHPDKEDTMVLDFTNDAEEIQRSFQPYYQATLLKEATDPNKLYDFKRILEDFHIYSKEDISAHAGVYFSKTGTQEKLRAVLDPVVQNYSQRPREDQEKFRGLVVDFVRLYAFLSHILIFKDVELEKLYHFLRHLQRLLPIMRERLPMEIINNISLEYDRVQRTSSGEIRLLNKEGELKPISELGTGVGKDELEWLSEIIKYINERYGTEFTSEDKVRHFADDMERRLAGIEKLRQMLNRQINPAEETRKLAFDSFFSDTLEDMMDSNIEIYKKITEDPLLAELLRQMLFRKLDRPS